MSFPVVTWRIRPAAWPSGRRLRIVALADPHVCRPWMPPSRIAAAIEQANALGGDVIVLLGDYPGHVLLSRAARPDEVMPLFDRLRAPLGVWAILGNHDWKDDRAAQRRGAGPTRWHRALSGGTPRLLENEAVPLADGVTLAGLGSQRAFRRNRRARRDGIDDLDGTLAQVPAGSASILLAHEPDIFPQVPDTVSVTLAGHLHGGQVRLFGYAPKIPSRFGHRYLHGHIEEGGRHMVVSGGLGFSGLPLRIGAPSEITVVELS